MNGGTNILLQELCLLIDVFICFGVPIIGIIILSRKYGKVRKAFFIGMCAFVVSQILLRIPILKLVLPNFIWYIKLQLNPYLYGIFLGLSAGVFEESARLVFMKGFLKGRTREADGLAFGLGHGGIEAMLITGIGYISSLILYPLGKVDLSGVGNLDLLIGGMERVFAMCFHVGASLIILYGIREHKALRYTILAILLHGLLDSMLVILPAAIGLGIMGIEIYIIIISILVLAFALRLFSKSSISIPSE